jgi:hypothetical protein
LKTYRCYIILLLLGLMAFTANAQGIGSAQTQVNVTIAQVQSLEISQPTVNINMSQTSHFVNGSASPLQSDHLKVTSNTGFEVSVKSVTQYFSLNGSVSTLPVNTIMLQTAAGSDLTGLGVANPPADTVVSTPVMLSTTATPLITADEGEGKRGYHVTYSVPATQSANYLNRASGVYSTTIIYTLVAQ